MRQTDCLRDDAISAITAILASVAHPRRGGTPVASVVNRMVRMGACTGPEQDNRCVLVAVTYFRAEATDRWS